MILFLWGKPLVFWFGLIILALFILQLYLGYRLAHGRPDYFKYHRLNAVLLSILVLVHLILGFLLYL